jgi:hypothetical protein
MGAAITGALIGATDLWKIASYAFLSYQPGAAPPQYSRFFRFRHPHGRRCAPPCGASENEENLVTRLGPADPSFGVRNQSNIKGETS